MTSLTKWRKEAALVMMVSVAMLFSSSACAGEVAPVDVPQVEAAIIAAQNQIVQGRLEDGLNAVEAVRAKVVTTDLADRVAFVAKLAEVRVAEKAGGNEKFLAALNEAFKHAKQPDQVQAVWAVGTAVARVMVANKSCDVTPVVDFLARGPATSLKQFSTSIDLAWFRMVTGNVGAAEAEFRNAAERAESAADWSLWVTMVHYLAMAADGGQSPQAGADVFTRLREHAKPIVASVDIAKGRYLFQRGIVDGVEELVEQAVANAATDADLLAALSLQYDLAIALTRSGKFEQAQVAIEKAEKLATACSACPALATIRGNAMMSLGQPGKAADIFWAAAKSVQTPQEQEQMLSAFGAAMVAAGDSATVAARLQDAETTPAVFVSVASAMVKSGDSVGALKLLAVVPTQALVEDAAAVAAIKPLMEQIQAQRQEVAKTQGERVRAIAAALDASAKGTKDTQAAEALAAQAAAMAALAEQVEK